MASVLDHKNMLSLERIADSMHQIEKHLEMLTAAVIEVLKCPDCKGTGNDFSCTSCEGKGIRGLVKVQV